MLSNFNKGALKMPQVTHGGSQGKRRKVCHFSSVHPYNDTRILFKECTSLAKAGYETHLVAVNAPDTIVQKVQVHGVPRKKKRLILPYY